MVFKRFTVDCSWILDFVLPALCLQESKEQKDADDEDYNNDSNFNFSRSHLRWSDFKIFPDNVCWLRGIFKHRLFSKKLPLNSSFVSPSIRFIEELVVASFVGFLGSEGNEGIDWRYQALCLPRKDGVDSLIDLGYLLVLCVGQKGSSFLQLLDDLPVLVGKTD